MSHIANQRIKAGGRHYKAGEPVELTDEQLADLPAGAVREADADEETGGGGDFASTVADTAVKLSDALTSLQDPDPNAGLKAAVQALGPEAFKKDGNPRAATLRELSEEFGRDFEEADIVILRTGGDI